MRSIRVRYLESRRLAGGRVAYYYNPKKDLRAAGILDRQPLGDDLAEAIAKAERLNAIADEYRAAKKRGEELKRTQKNPGSIAALFEEYRSKKAFTDRANKTREDYEKCMRSLENTVLKNGKKLGEMPAAKLEYRHADSLYDLLREKHGLSYANAQMRVARRIFGLGVRWKLVKENPFSRPSLKEIPSRRVVWSAEQMLLFMAAAHEQGFPSLALIARMAYELTQRIVDIRLLTWDSYENGVFSFEQTKTQTFLQLPASKGLTQELKALKRKPGEPIAPCESTGRAWQASHLTHTARDIMRNTGLPESLRLSDMRRTGLTHLGKAGATDDELVAMSGHLTREMLQTYSVADLDKATNAMEKREIWQRKSKQAPRRKSK